LDPSKAIKKKEKMKMKMKLIKKNITFCLSILFFVGLVTLKQNIVLMQKKEFSKNNLTKLIPKGFTSPLFFKENIFYVGLLYLIISNIALKINKNLAAAVASCQRLVVNLLATPTDTNVLLVLASPINPVNGLGSAKPKAIFSSLTSSPAEVPQTSNSKIKEQSCGEFDSFFPHKEKLTQLSFSLSPKGVTEIKSPSGDRNKNEIETLKPLLFKYLITKNNQNGIGLDIKNSKLTNWGSLPNIPFGTSKADNYNFNSSNCLKKAQLSLSKKVGFSCSFGEQKNWYLSEDLIKLIGAFFKSIYCLISKPKFINTPDKLIIEILYFITIPDFKNFKWYNFIYAPTGLVKGQVLQKAKAKRRNKIIKLLLRKNNFIKKTLFKLNNTNITKLYFNKFIILFKLLSSYFKKPIEFNLIKLHKSSYDSNILAQLFYLILKKKNIRSAIHNLYTKNKFTNLTPLPELGGKASPAFYSHSPHWGQQEPVGKAWVACPKGASMVPAYISGLYIHIGGRLMREPIIPRKTTKKFEKGAIATGKVNFVDTARITKKNKKGAYTIKIAFAQNFMFAHQPSSPK